MELGFFISLNLFFFEFFKQMIKKNSTLCTVHGLAIPKRAFSTPSPKVLILSNNQLL